MTVMVKGAVVPMRDAKKTNWKDIGDLRKPNSNWRLGGAAQWWARALGLPDGAVVFLNPDGRHARSDKTLKALRNDWGK
jgi:hypothetical protein